MLAVLEPVVPMLSVEGIISSHAGMSIPLFDPRWAPAHPDNIEAERDELLAFADEYERRVREGRARGREVLQAPAVPGEPLEFLVRSAAELRRLRSHPIDPTEE